ncbi:MAG TPA: RsmB/NOP family class I SAM-dependent RNA methyltransferase [Aliiroseovarius sp.]|nr:RsmB/NOP family class I SAM-dependent RNA methyltransferase [Aliiroseovarius sp.]
MTPAARIAAAIGILDKVLAGEPAEKALTNWARASRFAGSGDRAALRDHVFDALRNRASFAHLGGALTGRGLMIGALRAAGVDPATLFTGEGHAPAPLSEAEQAPPPPMPELVALDCPDWLAPQLRASLGDDFAPVMQALKVRAPVFLRVNLARADRETAARRLAQDGIDTRPHPLAETALEVTRNPRRVRNSTAYQQGLVELQDAAAQAICAEIPMAPGARVLDYCAGGGGKALALAARGARVLAHDAQPARLRDLPVRAARAGVEIPLLDRPGVRRAAPFDLVVADVPCSGSGAWRRSPEGKWRLTPDALDELCDIQSGILDEIADLVAPGGALVYITCSLLARENQDQVARFLARFPGWRLARQRLLTPRDGGDGFFQARLMRE